MYSSYCDCGKFVNWVDAPTTTEDDVMHIEKQVDELAVNDIEMNKKKDPHSFAWFISRGAEMCDVSDGVCKYKSIKMDKMPHLFIYKNFKIKRLNPIRVLYTNWCIQIRRVESSNYKLYKSTRMKGL